MWGVSPQLIGLLSREESLRSSPALNHQLLRGMKGHGIDVAVQEVELKTVFRWGIT